MAAKRGRQPGPFYVYLVTDESGTPLYVGKGSGRRCFVSAAKCGGFPSTLARFVTENAAYNAERSFIKKLKPKLNQCAGGGGPRTQRAPYRRTKEEIEIERIGSGRYAARFLLRKLDESNCERYGVSKVALDRLRSMAYGQGYQNRWSPEGHPQQNDCAA